MQLMLAAIRTSTPLFSPSDKSIQKTEKYHTSYLLHGLNLHLLLDLHKVEIIGFT